MRYPHTIDAYRGSTSPSFPQPIKVGEIPCLITPTVGGNLRDYQLAPLDTQYIVLMSPASAKVAERDAPDTAPGGSAVYNLNFFVPPLIHNPINPEIDVTVPTIIDLNTYALLVSQATNFGGVVRMLMRRDKVYPQQQ